MADSFPMTPRGQQTLRAELKHLKEFERPNVVKAIEEAREHGDLSENAEYDAAKNSQGLIEARIRDIETKLTLANVIDPASLSGDKVIFGATVTVSDVDTEKESTYIIVGEDEADIKLGLISITAPVTRALIGKSVGDTAMVRAPKGSRELEIIDIKFVALDGS